MVGKDGKVRLVGVFGFMGIVDLEGLPYIEERRGYFASFTPIEKNKREM